MPDVEFRLYGSPSDDDYYRECLQRVDALQLQNTVVFAGTTKEPWSVFQQADVVVSASVSEAFPYAVVEAMLSNAAVVATDVGGVPEAIGDAGLLVYPRDPAALAGAISTLLQSPERRQELGARARERALRWFTEERFVQEYRASYDQLVNPVAIASAPEADLGLFVDADEATSAVA